ncbi:prolyl aminopeptidase [Actinomadura darangshiensis]|uniref:Proline iminopeptidase n=1 Tax=Actinomadura darangshiensis TaxID=705336 RepID=A0A4V6PEL8_9ACTN|nr:prolyl aminopeptidase [Actinomadura darangshiensis]TDD73807.1 prolyl aminopeptidase [Actinomadura darangshiensis]
MTRYPEIEPHEHGLLDAGDGQLVYWEVCGNPEGKPALAVHGGPGSGCGPGWRRFFNPDKYRIVLFDQRNCGHSRPSAAEPEVDLSANTTRHLIGDMEMLRERLGIERWLLFGGSWGSTLALAYAQAHPSRVSEMVLFSVATTSAREVDWITRDMGRVSPEAWDRFRDHVPEADRDGNLAAAYSRLLHDPDASVRAAAAREWCRWEGTHVATVPGRHPDSRFDDPDFRLVFARLVTHYWAHAGWLDEPLVSGASKLAGIPGVLVHGALDISSPVDVPYRLAKAWPDAELVIMGGAGHGSGDEDTTATLVAALDRFA